MTNSDNLAEVETLLAERDTVVAWLARLDEAGGSVPVAVRERVRLDYQVRLDGATHRLKGHSDAITAKLAEDRADLEEQTTREQSARDALAEAELRHLVGEYDAARFAEEEKQHLAAVASCEVARASAADRVASLEQLLALIVGPPRAPSEPRATETTAPPAAAAATNPSDEPLVDLLEDEEEQLLTIFEESPELTELEIELVEAKEPEDVEAEASGSSGVSGGAGPLSFRPGSGMPTDREIPSFGMPAEVPARFTPVAEPVRAAPTPVAPTPSPMSATPTRRSPVLEEEIVASGPTPSPITAPIGRTARCGECGAMNRASEWYCEKCGAELTMS